tara:strand:+ start:111121 stop:111609 length:489 start_codon:yes stop_codon:yes gene_type:complete
MSDDVVPDKDLPANDEASAADAAAAEPVAVKAPAAAPMADDEPIPKLPRAPLMGKLSMAAIIRIGMFGTLFYAIIVMRKPCAEGAGRFIMNFDDVADAGPAPAVDKRYPGFELISAEEALKRWPDKPADDAGAGDQGDGGTAAKSSEGETDNETAANDSDVR